MTTTVIIAVQGNKPVEIHLTDKASPHVLQPGEWAQQLIHGDVSISVKEQADKPAEAAEQPAATAG